MAFDIGQRIRLESSEHFASGYRDSRISAFTQNVNIPTMYDLDISDVLSTGTVTQIRDDVDEIRHYTQTTAASIPDVVRSWEGTPASDFNLFSAKKAVKEFLSRLYPDVAQGLIKFIEGIELGKYVSGIETGTGAAIDKEGNAEMTSLTLRSFLKVPTLIYNKVQVTGGEMWNTEGGTIAKVEPDADSDTAFVLTMDIEDGDNIELQVDDICKGHYNKNGGFITSYFRVVSVNQTAKTIRVVLGDNEAVPGGVNCAPTAYMNIARYGNFTNEERQQSQYFSSSEQRISLLSGVDQYIIEPKHYKVVIGSVPEALLPENNPVSGRASIYLDNVIAKNFFQIDKDNEIIRTVRDRGLWSTIDAVTNPYQCNAQYQDEVYHNSCKYRCIVEGTTAEPRYDSTDWLLVAGDTTLTLDIESTDGETFLVGQLSTTLTAKVKRGITDITADILVGDWSWTRETGDIASDTIWNTDHAGCGNSVTLTNEDLAALSGRFICTAYVRDGAESVSAQVAF
uniref:hypothetical protein n=1 Tax=Alistipes sp. TaxID=1872444 RepID=UPI004055A9FB